MACRSFHTISNNKINHMDTLATIYDKIHVIECSGATLLLRLSLQTPYFRDTLSCPPLLAGLTSAHSYST